MELALNVTFVGLAVVFIALILLSFIISIFSKILNAGNKKDDGDQRVDYGVPTAGVDNDTTVSIHAEDDDELIAVLTAAVLASMGGSSESNIRVKSYRRIPQTSPVWNTISRKQQLASRL